MPCRATTRVAVALMSAPARVDPFCSDFAVLDLLHAHRRRIAGAIAIERV
jgi:hypothetical protein